MKGRKTGGRQAGTPNRVTLTLREQVEAEAGGPLPALLARIGRQALDLGDLPLAVVAFAKAAGYIYGRPKQEEERTAPAIVFVDGVPQLEHYPGPIIHIRGADYQKAITGADVLVVGDRVIVDDIAPLPPLG